MSHPPHCPGGSFPPKWRGFLGGRAALGGPFFSERGISFALQTGPPHPPLPKNTFFICRLIHAPFPPPPLRPRPFSFFHGRAPPKDPFLLDATAPPHLRPPFRNYPARGFPRTINPQRPDSPFASFLEACLVDSLILPGMMSFSSRGPFFPRFFTEADLP